MSVSYDFAFGSNDGIADSLNEHFLTGKSKLFRQANGLALLEKFSGPHPALRCSTILNST